MSMGKWLKRRIEKIRRHDSLGAWMRHAYKVNTTPRMRATYIAGGLGVRGLNLSCFAEPKFAAAWNEAVRLNREGWGGDVPNVEWRAHVACWAAQHGLSLEGDFVECGVHTGLLSVTICNYLDFAKQDRNFWLFDTWHGIPAEGEKAKVEERINEDLYYQDVFSYAKRNFSAFPNAKLIQGILPDTLPLADIKKVAYLSIDLNNVRAEMGVIDALWDRISPGAIIVLDDYAFSGFDDQFEAWNDFARQKGKMVVTLPTGQGLLIR